jgi:hypothetical protein
MADVKKATSVELTDALQAGFNAAIERIKTLNLDPCSTLIDRISQEDWNAWDASTEFAVVADSSGLNGDGDDIDDEFDVAA